ncbi:MAG TPA: hypothetical protein VKU02_13595 [Gemmataceae bacterium]|nr:hypothetical protein [Gemmataceae bacterium]
MSTLGKVLAILNVLAAIAFLCVAALDYGKRQAWMFAVLQEDFILRGLPVDEKEQDADGRPLVNLIGKRLQGQLFTGLSEPVKTQQEEAQRRHKALLAKIEEAGDPAQKKQIIASAIVPLAQSWGQRDELQRKLRDPSVSVENLLASDGPVEAAFKETLEGKTVADEPLAVEERRQAIAHLLFNLNGNPDDQRRALAVVGIRAYVHEADSQATALRNMAPQILHAMETDRTAFEIEHKDLIEQIVSLADRVRHLDAILQRQTLLAQEHTTLVAARKADVQTVRAEIDAAKKATDTALKGQSTLEDALFKARQAIATAGQRNHQLLRQIDALEFGR